MRTFAYSLHNVPLVCTLEYDPPQAQTDIDPARPAECELISAMVGQEDIYDLLKASDVALIAQAFLDRLEEWG